MPTISVVVPVYRVEKYIHRCVDSILNQTYRDFELILVDDGSPDNCGTICEEYAAKDSRVVVIHQENGGLSAARNAGIDWAFANSDSEWITFVDSDDYIHPEYLERLYDAAISLGTQISICNAGQDFDFSEEDVIPHKYPTEEAYCNSNLRVNRICAWGKLYRKKLWMDIRYPVGKLHEDRFTTHKLLFQVPEVANIKAALYHYTINPSGISHSKWTPRFMDNLEAVEQQLQFFEQNGFYRAKKTAGKFAVIIVSSLIQDICQSPETVKAYGSYIKPLRKKLRYFMRCHKHDFDLSIQNYCFVYEAAYPRLMKLYWYYRAVLRKLRIRK